MLDHAYKHRPTLKAFSAAPASTVRKPLGSAAALPRLE
ncbi:hypothetical protein EBBID32_9630 [Sphingobium indicum BiD32]|uniref:Uncharacterized protein n=1 Tax=Sphingobium indicum BiD32 TaxID=1301087 RepID=N1MI63_9SPHN|nr:hypothetical protein EBBID32_9630 [Sphingobium indicum BiD32]